MESRHDSENAERILYNMRPKELVSWVADPLAVTRSTVRAGFVAEREPAALSFLKDAKESAL